MADPHVELQDGPEKSDRMAREVTGEEKALWWDRAVAAYPDYADYQARTDRPIPVFVLESADGLTARGRSPGSAVGQAGFWISRANR